jgi:hypothetical protein
MEVEGTDSKLMCTMMCRVSNANEKKNKVEGIESGDGAKELLMGRELQTAGSSDSPRLPILNPHPDCQHPD